MEWTFLKLRHVAFVAAGATIVALTACSASEEESSLSGREDHSTKDDDDCGDDDDDDKSPARAPATDPAGSCCGGRGTCKPESEIAADARDKLSKCEGGGLCQPKGFVPGAPQKSCAAANGLGDGVCMSDCFGAVQEQKSLLGRSSCADGELCVPCRVASKPTGACMTGDGAVKTQAIGPTPVKKDCKGKKTTTGGTPAAKDAGTTPAPPSTASGNCCSGRGVCQPKANIPEEHRGRLDASECGGTGDKLCAPIEMTKNDAKPDRCTGSTFLGEYKGVCLSTCLQFEAFETFASSQGSCDATHRCMPCEVGITGLYTQKTGAPGCE